jgi:hypothetical protein
LQPQRGKKDRPAPGLQEVEQRDIEPAQNSLMLAGGHHQNLQIAVSELD